MKTEGVGFRHAVELLRKNYSPSPGPAVKVGTVPKLPCPLTMEADDRTVMQEVVQYYHRTLRESPEALAYRNVPVEDPTRNGKNGRFAISGVKLEIAEEKAVVVRRIFEMYGGGISQAAIAKTLNAECVCWHRVEMSGLCTR